MIEADNKNIAYTETDVAAMREAIVLSAMACRCAKAGEAPIGGPFGAVIYKDGKKVAGSCNHVLANNDPSAHGEVSAIREACSVLGTWDLSGCVLYTSCEPCPMCLMTAMWANISKIYFAATREDAAAIGFKDDELYRLLRDGIYGTAITECRAEAVAVMADWQEKFAATGQY